MTRGLVIHANNGNNQPLCSVKKWRCLNTPNDYEAIECKFCLRIIERVDTSNKVAVQQTESVCKGVKPLLGDEKK